MKYKLVTLVMSIMLVGCGLGSSGPPPTRGELIQDTVNRYERCLEQGTWSARQCREQYERELDPILP